MQEDDAVMATYAAFIPCTYTGGMPCKSQVHPEDMDAHLAWHAKLTQQSNLLKVALPLAGLSAALL